jgi:hypothetical protein
MAHWILPEARIFPDAGHPGITAHLGNTAASPA